MDNAKVFDAINNVTSDVSFIRKTDIDSLYDDLLMMAAHQSIASPEIIEEAMKKISFHETGGTYDPAQHQSNRLGKVVGPGRGLFQYELKPSKEYPNASGAGAVAMTRLYNFLGGDLRTGKEPDNFPDWMQDYFPKNKWGNRTSVTDVDFSKLDANNQKVLFLVYKLEEGINFSILGENVTKGDPKKALDNLTLWWSLNHHKGSSEDAGLRFRSNMHYYNAKKTNKKMGIIPDTSRGY